MSELLRAAATRLRAAGIESPRLETRILWKHVREDEAAFESAVDRRIAGEPIAYIVGYKEFWSLTFHVEPGVLIPRPETETLLEEALRARPDRSARHRILDLGTGSGCLLIALLMEFPNTVGIGIDRSALATDVARRNLTRHGLDGRGMVIEGSWNDAEGEFDLIVSNPPYIPSAEVSALAPDVRNHEPMLALDGGIDGLGAFRAIAPVLASRLASNGLGFVELGAGQSQSATGIFSTDELEVARMVSDLAGILRCLVVRRRR